MVEDVGWLGLGLGLRWWGDVLREEIRNGKDVVKDVEDSILCLDVLDRNILALARGVLAPAAAHFAVAKISLREEELLSKDPSGRDRAMLEHLRARARDIISGSK